MTSDLSMENLLNHCNRLWIFGYGSLCWKPGFQYSSRKLGFIRGYSRRFWQGNATHRGTPNNPGRVATLVKDEMNSVWGVAYELVGHAQIEQALKHCSHRELELGGYIVKIQPFQIKNSTNVIPVLVYMATPANQHYLGPASIDALAEQVTNSEGPSGHNIEYVCRLADWARHECPEENDQHLLQLDEKIRQICQERKICMRTAMGPDPTPLSQYHRKKCHQAERLRASLIMASLKQSHYRKHKTLHIEQNYEISSKTISTNAK
ncbi:unnamed protein product [Owenia fusiformis]|uniref:glutathione-specific gamma-glutamylcyclotransferase n=1 Tax=Owenia fusiformis TaxID=6347 RepID=A0A8J1U2Y4_OWEFU|nr:unnamed protein product [Owenia fusiformis]